MLEKELIKVLIPEYKTPFYVNEGLKFLFISLIFCVSIFMIVMGFYGRITEYSTVFMGIVFLSFSSLFLADMFYFRKRRLVGLKYLFYEDRLLIFDSKIEKEVHCFFYNNFPKIDFFENTKNYGFIVIGTPQEIVVTRGLKWGLNMSNNEIALENLPNVKQEYYFLKGLIESSKS